MILYFRDNFFNAGRTEIVNENQEPIGEIDLRNAFGSSLEVFGRDGGGPLFGGKFRMMSNKWRVTDSSGEECGVLRYRFTFMSKRYEYDRYGEGVFEITSPAFSRDYEVRNAKGELVVSFQKVSGWFESTAFRLTVHSGRIDGYEWVSVIMGMHEIRKRQNSAGAG